MKTECSVKECIYSCLLNVEVYLVLKQEILQKKELQTDVYPFIHRFIRLSIGGGVNDAMYTVVDTQLLTWLRKLFIIGSTRTEGYEKKVTNDFCHPRKIARHYN